jgi:predicted glycoside hydrolase/deacetylase ChbG (UPF0249 family)
MATMLVVNADDLGFSVGVTDGILRSHREGILTSATLMATMPDRERAVDLAGQLPGLGVGVHLCLTQGKPLTRCSRIAGRDGELVRSVPRLWWKLRSADARREAEEEMVAQIEWAKRRGVRGGVTHVDSHKHVVHLPALHGAVVNACLKTGVGWVRTAREIGGPGLKGMSPPYRVLASLAGKLAGRVTAAGLKTNDWFYGLATTGHTDVATIEALAKAAPEGIGELMVHPGYATDIVGKTRLVAEREAEMEALCDRRARAAVEGAGIRLVRYGEASSSR